VRGKRGRRIGAGVQPEAALTSARCSRCRSARPVKFFSQGGGAPTGRRSSIPGAARRRRAGLPQPRPPPYTLSGERQRLKLAHPHGREGRVLILDEPTFRAAPATSRSCSPDSTGSSMREVGHRHRAPQASWRTRLRHRTTVKAPARRRPDRLRGQARRPHRGRHPHGQYLAHTSAPDGYRPTCPPRLHWGRSAMYIVPVTARTPERAHQNGHSAHVPPWAVAPSFIPDARCSTGRSGHRRGWTADPVAVRAIRPTGEPVDWMKKSHDAAAGTEAGHATTADLACRRDERAAVSMRDRGAEARCPGIPGGRMYIPRVHYHDDAHPWPDA